MIKIIKSAKSIEEIREIVDNVNLYKVEKLKTLPRASYVEDYQNFSIYCDVEENLYFAISEKNGKNIIKFKKKKVLAIIFIIFGLSMFYTYNYTTIFWSQEEKQKYKEAQILIVMRSKFPDFLKLNSDYFIKEVFVNGKQVKWFEKLGESELISIMDLGISLEDNYVEVDYVQYSVNGFGWHINETKKSDRIKLQRESNNLRETIEENGFVTQIYKIDP